MAKPIFYNRVAVFGGYRLSRDSNSVVINPSRAREDLTDLEAKSEKYELGKWTGDFNFRGWTDDAIEKHFLALLAASAAPDPALPLSICMEKGNGAAGDFCFQIAGCPVGLPLMRESGRVMSYELQGKAQDRIQYGQILFTSVGTAGITGVANGPVVQLGAISSTQEMWVAYHLLNFPAASGTSPTLDSKIQSAAAVGFASPTDRLTLPQRTATVTGSVHRIAGPITDQYWRYVVTAVGGTASPTLYVLVTAAIVAV